MLFDLVYLTSWWLYVQTQWSDFTSWHISYLFWLRTFRIARASGYGTLLTYVFLHPSGIYVVCYGCTFHPRSMHAYILVSLLVTYHACVSSCVLGICLTMRSIRGVQNAGMVFLCEVLVDVIKHSFLAKFNEIKPGAYSEFLQALCKQVIWQSS